jgi:hypothetical protein
MSKALLTERDRKLLTATKRIMEEILETEEVLADRQLMDSIRRSKQDLKSERTLQWGQLRRELKSKGKL